MPINFGLGTAIMQVTFILIGAFLLVGIIFGIKYLRKNNRPGY